MAKRKPRDKTEQRDAPPPAFPTFAPADPFEREVQFADERTARLRPCEGQAEDSEVERTEP